MVLEEILLRQATVEDAEPIYEYGSDPVVARYADWPVRTSIEPLIEVIKSRAESWMAGPEYSWVIATAADNLPIGGITCRIEDESAEIGFLLNQRYWGRGYAGEAATAVIDWLFSLPGISQIWATCDTENSASIRVLEKLGFQRDSVLERAIVRPQISGDPRDAYLYTRNQRSAQQDAAPNP